MGGGWAQAHEIGVLEGASCTGTAGTAGTSGETAGGLWGAEPYTLYELWASELKSKI